jgi:hypothetical protein
VLYTFAGGSDGANPDAGLIFDASGSLYGTTVFGGPLGCAYLSFNLGCGVVFKLTPPTISGGAWTETVLHSFTGGSDGANPFAGLIFDASGALYGTTAQGGNTATTGDGIGGGTVFKLAPSAIAGGAWTETVLYSFCSRTGCSDGANPFAGLIFDASGALYGTTAQGGGGTPFGGTVFKLTPPALLGGAWTESVLHSFTSGSDGDLPWAALIFDASGALYGTTRLGGGGPSCFGLNDGCGTVFEITGSGFVIPVLVPPSEIATTASGLAYSRVSQTFNGTITLTNISSSGISGPMQILFTGLTAGVTLVNATGDFSGSPYLTVPGLASLAPGQVATVGVQFKDPSFSTINFTPVIYSGSL